MKSILVPVDFSDTSTDALKAAINIASRYSAGLTLLYVQGVPMTDPYAEGATLEVDAILEDSIHQRLRDLVATMKQDAGLKAKLDPLTVQTVVRTGFAAGEIARLAKEEKVDWIVMGTRGGGGLSGALFGSVTAAVTGRADRPVLAIPKGYSGGEFKHMVCAIDRVMDGKDRLKELEDLAAHFRADLSFVHVVEEKEVSTTGVTAATLNAYSGIQARVEATAHAISGEDVEEALTAYCQEHNADLLVMVREHHPFLQKLIHRSATRRLALHSAIPLLVLPPQ